MRRKRHSPVQNIVKLLQAEAAMAEGGTVAQLYPKLGVSEQTLHRWRNQYGGMKGPEMKRRKELEGENRRLKRLVAD